MSCTRTYAELFQKCDVILKLSIYNYNPSTVEPKAQVVSRSIYKMKWDYIRV